MAESDLKISHSGYQMATFGERLLAYLIDMAIIIGNLLIVSILFYFAFLIREGYSDSDLFILVVLFIPVSFVMSFILELLIEIGMNGQTPGKIARRIKVLKLDGSNPRLMNHILRWVLRPVDMVSFGVVALLRIKGVKGRRLGDLAAGTLVVKISRPEVSCDTAAGQRKRFLAYVMDWCIIVGAHAFIWPVLLTNANLKLSETYVVVYSWFFLTVVFYTVFFEIVMKGQTPGKKACNLKVYKIDGSSPNTSDYLIRWMYRPLDTLLGFWKLKDPYGRGLGDLATGTVVVNIQQEAADIPAEAEETDKPEAPGVLIENIAEASKNARSIYFLFSGLLAYCALTVAGTSDRQIILNEPARLPVINIDVSLENYR